MSAPRLGVGRRYVMLAMALGSALLVAACASILGIEDRSPVADASSDGPSESGAPAADAVSELVETDRAAPDAQAGDATGPDGTTTDAAMADSVADAPGSPDAPGPDVAPDAPQCADPCPIATGLNRPWTVASDSNSVYWTEFGDGLGSSNGYVKSCPVAGCAASGPLVYAQGLTNPRGLAVDAQYVYYGTASYGGASGAIWKCGVGGCNGSPAILSSAVIPYGLAVDATYVYWTDWDDGTIHKVPKAGGGTETVLYDGGPVDDAGTYENSAQDCVVDGTYLYFVDNYTLAWRVPIGGGPAIVLGSSSGGGRFGITADLSNLYFSGLGVVLKTPKTVADAAPIATTITDPSGLAYDPGSGLLYWANWGSGAGDDGTIGKMSVDGGGQHVMRSALVYPLSITVNGSYVFWASHATPGDAGTLNPSTGVLWRTAK